MQTKRFHVLKCRIPRCPLFVWRVAGRKIFDRRYSPAIRAMWGVGDYGV